jgi:endo-1,3-1,4-beta-glycanase ExoK
MKLPSRLASHAIIAAALTLLPLPGPLQAEDAGTAFRDDFDKLDPARWFISDGWTNGPHQNCTWSESAVNLADGLLTLSFLPAGDGTPGHRCGEIQSKPVFSYGTYEARIRTSTGSGLNAAFFTYIGPVHKAPHDEIDFEVLTRDTGEVSLNTFVSGEQKNGTTVPVDPPTDQAFHVYSFTWTPDRLTWFIDGKEVHHAEANLPVTPQKIYLSLWGSDTLTDWMGPFTAPDGPVTMEVDWVAFTPLGTPCPFPDSALCQTP